MQEHPVPKLPLEPPPPFKQEISSDVQCFQHLFWLKV